MRCLEELELLSYLHRAGLEILVMESTFQSFPTQEEQKTVLALKGISANSLSFFLFFPHLRWEPRISWKYCRVKSFRANSCESYCPPTFPHFAQGYRGSVNWLLPTSSFPSLETQVIYKDPILCLIKTEHLERFTNRKKIYVHKRHEFPACSIA